jgi:hypothetical protein
MPESQISKNQLRRLQTLWGILYKHTGEAGAEGDSRKLRLAWIGLKIGRPVGSCKDLTVAEAKTAIDAMQKLLPPDLVRKPAADRGQAQAYGRAGRKGAQSKEVRLPDAGTFQLLSNLLFALGWNRARLDTFLHSPKSPVRGTIRTLADANKIIWVLKGMLRRRDAVAGKEGPNAAKEHDRSDGGNGSPNSEPVDRHDRPHV